MQRQINAPKPEWPVESKTEALGRRHTSAWWVSHGGLGIDKTRQLFGHPKLLSLTGKWVREFPPYRRSITFSADMGGYGILGAEVDTGVRISPPQDAKIEERVTALEANVRHLNERLDTARKEFKESVRIQTEALENERNERIAEDEKIGEKLEVSETGGLHISLMGAVWLFFGVVLSGAPEIVWLLASS